MKRLFTFLLGASMAFCAETEAQRFYAGAAPGSTIDYEIREGETLFHVAEKFLGSPYGAERLAKENNIADPLKVRPGTRIRVPAPSASPAFRYSIERIASNGDVSEFRPNDRMSESDRFLLRLSANTSGYLYVFSRQRNGSVSRLFPQTRAGVKIQAFTEYMLPTREYFQLDRSRNADEQIWMVLTRRAEPDLEDALEAGSLDEARVREFGSAVAEKGIVITSDSDEDDSDQVVRGNSDGRWVLVHPIRIRRR